MNFKTNKYSPLKNFLCSINSNELHLTFLNIENILKAPLPKTAYTTLAWWTYNDATHCQSEAWTAAKFKPQVSLKDKYVIFKRVDNNE